MIPETIEDGEKYKKIIDETQKIIGKRIKKILSEENIPEDSFSIEF